LTSNSVKALRVDEANNDQIAGELPTEPPGGLDARFCEVMDAAPVMIWVSGKDKGCVWFNQPWLTFTGRSMAQEVGNGWTEGVYRGDFDRCLKVYTSHFDARREFRMHYRLRRHDGEYRWIDDTGVPRYAHDGTFLGYIGSCVDVHEQQKTQTELRHRLLEIAKLNRQADAAAVAASIAHEINQPLAAMVTKSDAGLLALAPGKTPDVGKLRQILDGIASDGQRAAKIIRSLRSIFKHEQHIGTPLSVNELIFNVLTLIEPELQSHNITVQTTLDDALPQILGDRVQLQQVMVNLISNAIDAMNAVADDSRVLHLKTELEDAKNVRITVQDSGPGIEVENIERIFDRFFTTKSQGMGMGLSICRSIVEAHGGRLWADAGVHRGSLLLISLPIGQRLIQENI
jgi:PAS domain S-box-containing protein